jgi:putative transposase
MCLRFAFLLITRITTWLRLSRREEAWQTAEILILRHQLAVLQRRQPRRPHLTWVDRALLAALPSAIPNARRQGLRLLVTPDTILRWHRDIIRRRWAARSKRGRTGRPATRRTIKALVLRLAKENPGRGDGPDCAALISEDAPGPEQRPGGANRSRLPRRYIP